MLGISMQEDNTALKYSDAETHEILGKYCYRWTN